MTKKSWAWKARRWLGNRNAIQLFNMFISHSSVKFLTNYTSATFTFGKRRKSEKNMTKNMKSINILLCYIIFLLLCLFIHIFLSFFSLIAQRFFFPTSDDFAHCTKRPYLEIEMCRLTSFDGPTCTKYITLWDFLLLLAFEGTPRTCLLPVKVEKMGKKEKNIKFSLCR